MDPTHANDRFDAARISGLIRSGQAHEARERCRAAIEAQQGGAQAWVLLGACEQQLGRRDAAVAALSEAAAHSRDIELHQHVAEALLKLSAFDVADGIIRRLDFSRPQAVLLQARCRWGQGDYERAVEQLTALHGFAPGWPLLAVSLARMLVNLDRPERAAEVLDETLAERPQDAQLLHQRVLLSVSADGPADAAARLAGATVIEGPLRSLSDALAAVNGNGSTIADHPGETWAGFRELLGAAAPGTRWFGDNVALLKHALTLAPAEGAVVECGVHHGRTVNLLAGWAPDRRVHGFDSFQGLPEAWSAREPAGSYSTGGRLPRVRDNVELVPGWFADTLAPFAASLDGPIALLHVDCDLYSSTREVLAALGPALAPGSVVVFDEYVGYPGWREHEYRAWGEHRRAHGLNATLVAAQLLGQSAAFRIDAERAA